MRWEFTSASEVVEQLKPLIDQSEDSDERHRALEALEEFERIPWHPLPFMWAYGNMKDTFQIVNGRFTRYMPPADRPEFSAAEAVYHLVMAYKAELDYLEHKRQNPSKIDSDDAE